MRILKETELKELEIALQEINLHKNHFNNEVKRIIDKLNKLVIINDLKYINVERKLNNIHIRSSL